jgi:hypothetical protein
VPLSIFPSVWFICLFFVCPAVCLLHSSTFICTLTLRVRFPSPRFNP